MGEQDAAAQQGAFSHARRPPPGRPGGGLYAFRGRPPGPCAAAPALRILLPGVNPSEMAGKAPSEVSHADGLRLGFGDGSWVLIRQARAAPVVRVYAEAPDTASRDALVDAACALVSSGAALP